MAIPDVHAQSARFVPQSAACSSRGTGAVRLEALLLMIGALFWALSSLAQTSDSRATDQLNNSWTATSDLKTEHVNPTRIIESHSQSGNRTIDTRSIQARGMDGRMEPYQDIETETLRLDANTVRVTTRTFAQDLSRRKALVQVTEEEKHTTPGGNSTIVRLTSNPDLSGKLQPVQRDIVETKKIGTDAEATDTTVMLVSINGGLAPAFKTHEMRKRLANNTIESTITTFLLDGAGHWQANEVRQATIEQEGTNHSTEEHISRLDSAGKLGEVSRVVRKESESAAGEKRNTVETFSVEVPGTTSDGKLHLVERTTSTQRRSHGEQITEKQVEKVDAGDPNSGLYASTLTSESVRSEPSGEQRTTTTSMRQLNGSFGVVSVQTASDRVLAIQVQQTPAEKN